MGLLSLYVFHEISSRVEIYNLLICSRPNNMIFFATVSISPKTCDFVNQIIFTLWLNIFVFVFATYKVARIFSMFYKNKRRHFKFMLLVPCTFFTILVCQASCLYSQAKPSQASCLYLPFSLSWCAKEAPRWRWKEEPSFW